MFRFGLREGPRDASAIVLQRSRCNRQERARTSAGMALRGTPRRLRRIANAQHRDGLRVFHARRLPQESMNAPHADLSPAATAAPHVMNTYGRLPFALSHGIGCRVWDTEGREYLDALGGIAVNTLGHAHPRLVPALQEQIGRLIHCSNYYQAPLQERLAAKLCKISGLDTVFFCNSGLEANEAALKIARKFGHDKGIDRPEIIVHEKAFHGRSIATLSATGNSKVQAGFGPLVEGFIRVPLNDVAAIEEVANTRLGVVAVFLEVIQGEGGINPATGEYLRAIRRLCDEHDWLLMLDEVQCGIGRTGKWFAHQWAGIKPDVMPLAKGLGSGVPVGAVVCGPRAATVLGPGNHGTTFGGNPLAMRAGIETLAIMEADGLLESAARVGAALRAALERELAGVSGVVEFRGQGLMIGIELDRPCGELLGLAAQAGLLISVTAERVVRLLPPLILTLAEAEQVVAILAPLIRDFLAAPVESA
jgi:acetylornithine aminotransferase